MEFKTAVKPWNGDPSADRETYIGGSDAGTILGLNKWKSPYTLYMEKSGKIPMPDISDKEAVWWGNYDEDGVARRFTEKTGEKVQKSNKTYYLEDHPYIVGHIDRKLVGKNVGLECKTTSGWNKTDYESGDMPPAHYAQCQHYMMVTGWDTWYIATKRDNSNFYIIGIPRNEEYIQELFEKEVEFWENLQKGIPPEIDGSDSTGETIEQMYPADKVDNNAEAVTITKDIEENLKQIAEIDKAKKELEESKEAIVNQIKAWMGETPTAIGDDYKISYKASKGKTTIDMDLLKMAEPKIYAKYAKTGDSYRTFRITKIKKKEEKEEEEWQQ